MRVFILIFLFILIIFSSCQKEPCAGFQITSSNCFIGDEIYFMNTSDESYEWLWDFGDKGKSEENSPYHTYEKSGTYTVTLTAFSQNGKKSNIFTEEITVHETTKNLLTGTWKLTEMYDDLEILSTHLITDAGDCYISIDSSGDVISTAGPMFMFIGFGYPKYSTVVDTLDNYFHYYTGNRTSGEIYMPDNSLFDDITIQMKMSFDNVSRWNYLLNTMSVQAPSLAEPVIYFKFSNVILQLEEANPEEMTWLITSATIPEYTLKDQYGDYIPWTEISSTNLSLCSLVFEKTDSIP